MSRIEQHVVIVLGVIMTFIMVSSTLTVRANSVNPRIYPVDDGRNLELRST